MRYEILLPIILCTIILSTPSQAYLNNENDCRGQTCSLSELNPHLLSLAESGDASAQYKIGTMFDNGVGVEENRETAAKWYAKSARVGYTEAEVALGDKYNYGDGVERNYNKAVDLFEKASRKMNPRAYERLGYMYENGRGVEQDAKRAKKLYTIAGELGYGAGYYNLALMYEKGRYVKKDRSTALKWFIKSADAGDKRAIFDVAYYYLKEPATVDKGIDWLTQAANNGNTEAQYKLGKMYKEGRYIEKNKELARHWLTKASKQDTIWSTYAKRYLKNL